MSKRISFLRPGLALAACLLAGAAAHADVGLSYTDSDLVLPNSPFKANMPDAGIFNPTGPVDDSAAARPLYSEAEVPAPAAYTYPPAIVLKEKKHKPKAYALVAAPTLPCAPGYCPLRAPRRDRN